MMSPSLPSNLVHNLYQAVPTVWLFSLHWLQAGMWLLGLLLWSGRACACAGRAWWHCWCS